ncbi:stemmadenine O-acetyltransferase-like [Punica granatum]|uniref:Uncharacterized protein n=2 Tax=Punica granatum TaxID=22663 RepID=A0A218WDQ0_PUNGR|nr:stemmadenine O-acetyltransferase-like [Punica granatum]OWM70588.1 hypothetical protein CDL15_Pgr014261 [Punica granatum]PKI55127.1 hypothetical protein CRG98_024418 [Punica granatum]
MEVIKIITQELIVPCSPTAQHLRTYKLSVFDQLVIPPYASIILFYPSNSEPNSPIDVPQKIDLLKRSLSQILGRFYPLAGRIQDGSSVECDDKGARFIQATVGMSLTQFLTDPDLILLNELFPSEPESPQVARAANIQVNVFQCGGIAVALSNTHKLHDGAALAMFLKVWAAIAQGGGCGGTTAPYDHLMLQAAELFPAKEIPQLRDLALTGYGSIIRTGNNITKRFLFSRPAIEALKARGSGPTVKYPTRVEAVSSFLWKCVMAALERKNNGLKRPSVCRHLVNIRRRMDPPLSEFSLGGLLWRAIAHCKNTTDSDRTDAILPSLVGELRRAVAKIDSDFISRLRHEKNLISSYAEEISGVGSSKDGVDIFTCSSWCKLGFYDADFGWGRPIYVCSARFSQDVFFNYINLVETRSGDGIEAWVTLDEQEMASLELDPELWAFASLNPNPLIFNS